MNPELKIFTEWVKTELNPWRIENGLRPSLDVEIEDCFDIIERFNRHFPVPTEGKGERG